MLAFPFDEKLGEDATQHDPRPLFAALGSDFFFGPVQCCMLLSLLTPKERGKDSGYCSTQPIRPGFCHEPLTDHGHITRRYDRAAETEFAQGFSFSSS